jgi:Flp pilus assembly protein TadG
MNYFYGSSAIMRLGNKSAKIGRGFKRWLKSDAGSVTQLLGLSAIPLFLSVGAAVDTVRLSREQTAFHAAVDSAVLAIAADDRSAISGLSAAQQATRITELKTFGQNYINANYKSSTGTVNPITLDLAITNQAITLSANQTFPTAIMGLIGVNSFSLTSVSEVKKAMRPVELTLVMDTTGSMASDGKIAGAKAAAHSLLTTLYGGSLTSFPQSQYLRVSLVPFATAVRLDQNAYDFNLGWIDTAGANPLSHLNFTDPTWNNYMAWGKMKSNYNGTITPLAWNGCVEARAAGSATSGTDYNQNDAPPTGGSDTLFPAYFDPDSPVYNNTQYGIDYITQDSKVPNEITGLTTAQAYDTSNAGMMIRQKNQAKYDGRAIVSESVPNAKGPWTNCAASAIVPMTYKRANVDAGIDKMSAAGNTMIAEGLAWGWRSISPGEPFTKVEGSSTLAADVISPYDDVRWRKVMVLMTDGDNNIQPGSSPINSSAYSSYGFSRQPLPNRFGTTTDSEIMPALDNGMLSVCDKIKAKNIELYVTAFGSGVSTSTQNRLKACASAPSDTHYSNAQTSADLQAFFDHIGQDTINKSIYVSK